MDNFVQHPPKPPDNHTIIPRDIQFKFDDNTPKVWFGGDLFKTAFFNALFTLFPPGEDFFVRSVAHYRGQVKDQKQQQEVTNFIIQEGIHSRCHQDHLDILDRQGYKSLKRENKFINAGMLWMNKRLPRFSLASTVALEHFTAMLSNQAFVHADLFVDPAHEDFLPLFKWHALEELEHKAVAFDVYKIINGGYLLLMSAMLLATVGLAGFTLIRMVPLLYKDGVLFKWKTWQKGLPFLYGRQGIFTISWRHYLKFYNPNFHPWQIQDYFLADQVREEYEAGTLLANS